MHKGQGPYFPIMKIGYLEIEAEHGATFEQISQDLIPLFSLSLFLDTWLVCIHQPAPGYLTIEHGSGSKVLFFFFSFLTLKQNMIWFTDENLRTSYDKLINSKMFQKHTGKIVEHK